jgi:hypothetical protein
MTTKLTKVPIKKQVPRNDCEHETAIEKAYQQGRDELEKEYASGSSFIRAGEHIYVHTRFSDRLEKEAYQRGMSDAPKTRYGGDGWARPMAIINS